jgi:membrane-associated phospholipid phosphatase
MKKDIEIEFIKTLQKFPGKNKQTVNKFMAWISAPFHAKLYVFIIGLLYWFGKITKTQIFILCSSQFVIFAIKYLVRRKRPFQSSNEVELREPMDFDPFSFPSGHTLNAFLLSYILRKNININFGVLPYLVGLSRVYLGVHYPSDIIGGFLLTKIILTFSK